MDAAEIIAAAHLVLQDDGTRWTIDEMVGWINAGVREIVMHRPDVRSETVSHTLVEGTRQTIPATALKLIEVIRADDGRPVSLVKDRRMLDVSAPNWHRMRPVQYVRHFLFDLRDTDVFYVYPPAMDGAKVDMVVVTLPAAVTSADNALQQPVIDLPDTFQNALTDYVLYRAFSKDAEYAGQGSLAGAHHQTFISALTGDLQSGALASPNTRGTVRAESSQPT